MERPRITLDSANFAGRLRDTSRGSAYISRPTPRPATTISDVRWEAITSLQTVQKAQAQKPVVAPTKLALDGIVHTAKRKPAAQPLQAHRPQKSQVLHRKAAGAVPLQASVPVIHRQFTPPERPPKKSLIDQFLLPAGVRERALYGMAALLFIVGLSVSLNGLRTNRQVAAQVKQLSSHSESDGSTSTPPSTTKPSAAAISGYTVAPNLPRYIDIPSLAVHARVMSMGVDSKNRLKAPGNVYDAGWYNASAQPGQPGAMLIDGHISSWTTKGVFYGLNKLKAGDTITITRGDGKVFNYGVVKAEVDDASSVDMSSLLVSQNTAKPGLNLISCSGDVIPGTNEFDKRIVVYTVLQ